MKWTITLPRVVAEDDKASAEVEADSIEDAILAAGPILHGNGSRPLLGQTYIVTARVQVVKRTALPLRSV